MNQLLVIDNLSIRTDADGRERARDQARMTGKGLARLATLLQKEVA